MYAIVVCVLFLVWYLSNYLKWRKDILIPMEKIPGIKRYPIVGTTYLFAGLGKKEIFSFYAKHLKEMPPLCRSWNGSTPEINLRKPEHLEIIMNNTVHVTKGKVYNYLLPWLGEGLLTSTGSRWHEHRKLITPTFHFKILENFMEVFVEKTNILLNQLREKADGPFFDIYPNITHCTLDIICETAMGVSINAMTNNDSDYVKSIYRICDLILWRAVRPYTASNALFYLLPAGREFRKHKKLLHAFSNKVIMERRELLEKQKSSAEDNKTLPVKTRLSFLDLLLKASENNTILSDEDIREEVDTFMFEGHDTTTASIAWTLFLLGNNPDIQNKAFLELQEVLGTKNVATSLAELNQLKYLECIIKETLRLYPSVALIARTITEEVYIDKYRIPSGVQAVLHIYQVHRDEKHFPEPEKFDPDRFLPENSVGRHPYSYIPFSAGPRNCIGQKFAMYEEKTILASIIKNFIIRSEDTQERIKLTSELILRPADGIKLKLIQRNL